MEPRDYPRCPPWLHGHGPDGVALEQGDVQAAAGPAPVVLYAARIVGESGVFYQTLDVDAGRRDEWLARMILALAPDKSSAYPGGVEERVRVMRWHTELREPLA